MESKTKGEVNKKKYLNIEYSMIFVLMFISFINFILLFFFLFFKLFIKELILDALPMQSSDHPEEQVDENSHDYSFDNLKDEVNPKATLKEYLFSIIYMPCSLRQV